MLFPEAAKRFGGKGLQNALGRALSLGRVGAMMTPVGAGITALGLGKMGIEALIDERERILNMTPEELEIFRAEQEEQDRINEMRENDPIAYQEYLKEQQELMDVSA